MVQHDNRVQMQGRQSRQGTGAGMSGRRQMQNANVMPILYDAGEEWYEEDAAAGQGQNPYLEDYARQRSRRSVRQGTGTGWGKVYDEGQLARQRKRGRQVEVPVVSGRPASARSDRSSHGTRYSRQTASSRSRNASSGRAASRSAARSRRRKRILMQRMIVCLWAVCIFLAAAIFLLRDDVPPVSGGSRAGQNRQDTQQESRADKQSASSILVQGLPAEEFAKHPEWEENFLTPNEYSRPGDPLESVKNIFVHYTANPGTSAAQNRSYFEQQKDVHQSSVSAHFIIGYEGEIIQCVPLDEVAYAVQTRNYDSISIECCHLAKDGSFTQETYDSLISLLAWLTDVYGLKSEDILRHYDCGGKKCPLYYTDNPDAWTQLKNDVDKL